MNNKDDKPSFFDPSEEANTWPPSSGYEAEDKDSQNNSEEDFDYLDSILGDNSSSSSDSNETIFNNDSISTREDTEEVEIANTDIQGDFLVPKNPEPEVQEEIEEENEYYNVEAPNPDSEKTASIDSSSFDQLEFEAEQIKEENQIPDDHIDTTKTEAAPTNDFNVEDLFDNTTENYATTKSEISNNFSNYSYNEDEEVKPFRTYSNFDYTETETIAEPDVSNKISGLLGKVNRNVLILAVVVIGFGIYYLVSTLMSRNYNKYEQPSRTRSPRKPKPIAEELKAGRRSPVWKVSNQKRIDLGHEANIVRAIYQSAGRENPFSIPDSILADYRKAAQIAMTKQMGPNTYKRKAYRATLIGVLTSQDSTVALIDIQEASFDIVEGTGKTKILQLATKAMDKAKRNTQEMLTGSYVGPWAITKIESAKNGFTEAKVTIEYEGQRKLLHMGKGEELGIFDEDGKIDNLENPIENVSLRDM